jgi:hypothetical protein
MYKNLKVNKLESTPSVFYHSFSLKKKRIPYGTRFLNFSIIILI